MSALIPALIDLVFPGLLPLGRGSFGGGGGGGGGGGRGGSAKAPKEPKPTVDPMDKSADRQMNNMMDDSLQPKGRNPIEDQIDAQQRRLQELTTKFRELGG